MIKTVMLYDKDDARYEYVNLYTRELNVNNNKQEKAPSLPTVISFTARYSAADLPLPSKFSSSLFYVINTKYV